MESYDYIVVGAGSSGCVIAEQLSADGKSSVLVLEAGGSNDSFWVDLPKGVAKLVTNPDHVWAYPVAEARVEGEEAKEVWIRGKGLGGSSAVNGMIWSRGEPADYDAWERDAGATGWNARTMMARFLELEDHAMGAGDLRGAGGRVHVDPAIHTYPLVDDIIAAGENMGLRRVDDINAATGPRVGLYSHNIRKGVRQSAARTFLAPAAKRDNVTVLTDALAHRILFEDRRASAIEVEVGGSTRRIGCSREVIVCGGAMESPLLLQRSGIGDAERLKAAGIEVIAHSPDVGEKMIEHLSISIPYRLEKGRGSHKSFFGIGLMAAMAKWMLTKTGVMATGPFEVGAFLNVAHPDGRTDTQFYLGGYTFAIADNDPVPLDKIDKRPGVTIYGQLLRLTSEGSIRVTGPAPTDTPEIRPNWLSTEHDRKSAVALIRAMREYMDAQPLGDMLGDEVIPGRDVETDEEILDAFRRYSTCGLHAIGTCRMGGDEASVVDPALKVRGVKGLRVADCSVIPGHVTGNTNAPAMALGLQAAELILADRA